MEKLLRINTRTGEYKFEGVGDDLKFLGGGPLHQGLLEKKYLPSSSSGKGQ